MFGHFFASSSNSARVIFRHEFPPKPSASATLIFLVPQRDAIVVSVPGGTVGDLSQTVQGVATFAAGEEVVLVGGYGIESLTSVLIYDPQGVPPAPVKPVDRRLIGAMLLIVLLLLAAAAWSLPGIRQRVKGWRPQDQSEEWIT